MGSDWEVMTSSRQKLMAIGMGRQGREDRVGVGENEGINVGGDDDVVVVARL